MLHYITSENDLSNIKSKIYDNEILALDIETTALRPKDGRIRLVQLKGDKAPDVYIVDVFKVGEAAVAYHLRDLLAGNKHKKIAHNLKFEYQWVLSKLGIRLSTFFDTYMASCLVDFTERHGLADVVEKYLKVSVDKTEQRSDWSRDELTKGQLDYAAEDTRHLHALRDVFIAKLLSTGQLEAMKFEMDALPAIAEMEMSGIAIDTDKYGSLVEKITHERDKRGLALLDFLETRGGSKDKVDRLVQEDLFGSCQTVSKQINIDSWQQVLPIYQSMGIPITTTDAKELQPMLQEYPDLIYLLDYREQQKLVSTYGQSLLDKVDNGRLYTDFNQAGTITFRLSSRNPNLQNLPSSTDFRGCFAAPNGRKLIISDYSQFELRILANHSKDPVMLEAYTKGIDLHSMTTHKVFGVPIEEAATTYANLRKASKITNFSVVYGISPAALAMRLKASNVDGADEAFAETLIEGFLGGYAGAGRWLKAQESRIMKEPYVRTVAGHLIRLRFDRDDKKSVNSAKRNSRNYPIQSGNSCSMKLALTNLHRDLVANYKDAKIVMSVHDEALVECSEGDAEQIKYLTEKYMREAGEFYFPNVPIKADPKICDNWGEKG